MKQQHEKWRDARTLDNESPIQAVCGKAARTDLCGGREVTRVPTATGASSSRCSAAWPRGRRDGLKIKREMDRNLHVSSGFIWRIPVGTCRPSGIINSHSPVHETWAGPMEDSYV